MISKIGKELILSHGPNGCKFNLSVSNIKIMSHIMQNFNSIDN